MNLFDKSYEFNATLKDHPIGDQNIYRLYYINYHRIGTSYGHYINNIGVIDWPCEPFMLPEGMTREEGFKVLSYLTDFIEKRKDVEIGSLRSTRILDQVLDLERLGFKKVKENDENKILNLFTVDGRVLLFKMSKLYRKYFEWYTENITLEEVQEIYAKHNMEFRDIVWHDKESQKEISLNRTKN